MSTFNTLNTYIASCVYLMLVTQPADALWLKAYGTLGKDTSGEITKLDQGSYIITGTSNSNVNWYDKIDAQGSVLWSKSLGASTPTFNNDGSVNINETRTIDPATFKSVHISGKGILDPNTGNITVTSTDKNVSISSNDGYLYLGGVTSDKQVVQGYWQTTETNADVAFARLDANNKVVSSHRYDVGNNDSGLTYPLKSGYLLMLYNNVYDFTTSKSVSTQVLTKLDTSGNIIAGSSKKINNGSVSYYLPTELADGSMILTVNSKPVKDFTFVKVDSNSNVVWEKR